MLKRTIRKINLLICFIVFVAFFKPAASHAALPNLYYSVFGGEVLPGGVHVFSVGMGWPSVYGQFTFPINQRFDMGIRGHLYYGMPAIGFGVGLGTGIDIPMRINLWENARWSVALKLEPGMFLGFGDEYIYAAWHEDVTIFGIKFEPGVNVGFKANNFLTVTFGAGFPFSLLIVVPEDSDEYVDVDVPIAAWGGIEMALTETISFYSHMKIGPAITSSKHCNYDNNNVCHLERGTDYDAFFQLYFGFNFAF